MKPNLSYQAFLGVLVALGGAGAACGGGQAQPVQSNDVQPGGSGSAGASSCSANASCGATAHKNAPPGHSACSAAAHCGAAAHGGEGGTN
jgi:hypothetical protein